VDARRLSHRLLTRTDFEERSTSMTGPHLKLVVVAQVSEFAQGVEP
jgi:hypothetical protein